MFAFWLPEAKKLYACKSKLTATEAVLLLSNELKTLQEYHISSCSIKLLKLYGTYYFLIFAF